MKINQHYSRLSSQERLNAMTPNHQDFNFDLWAVAVREQMISVLAHKSLGMEKGIRSGLDKSIS